MKLHPLDIAVMVFYFAGMVGFGFWCSKRNQSTENYFLGNRNFPGWAIGISFIGAMISSVTFIALPADSFKTAWVRYLPYFGFPLLILLSIFLFIFIPFFRRGTVTSAYQYLDLRFGPSVSAYGACVFLAAQIIRTASVVYLMAVLMATLTGLSVELSILIASGITALYTIKGGFSAVVWTDVIQTLILVTGAVLIIAVLLLRIPGGLGEVIQAALVAGKLNQESVQRWCSASSAREARKSMVVLGIGSLPVWAAFMFMGTCLWVYYRHFPDGVATGILAGTQKAESILPHFIVTVLPTGLSGVVISAALAAAMSILSSAINSGSMVLVQDLYRRHWVQDRADRHYLVAGRLSSLVISALMIGGAFVFHYASSKTLNDFVFIITALLGGGIAGMFLFGILCRRGDARAVLIGIGAPLLFTLYAILMQFKVLPRTFDPYYTAILGNLVMLVACYAASLLLPVRPRDLTNLTFWDRTSEPLQ